MHEYWRKEETRMTKKVLVGTVLAFAPTIWAESIAGLWSATVNVSGTEIPFKIEFSMDGATFKGWFFNGEEREISTGGTFENGSLVLHFDSYASTLKATVRNGVLEGEYVQRGKALPIHAVRAVSKPRFQGNVPDISGLWYLQGVASSKHDEKAWHFVVEQHGAEVSGAILRVDGDTGTLTGSWQNGKFVLSHFSGARPALVVVTPQPDGTLAVEIKGQHHAGAITALRPERARAAGLELPPDYDQHAGVKDPSKAFTFRFPNLDGEIVSNRDARFQGKVVLINITGSWCPNCHDEDEFLPELYQKYHSQGLEIVALDFEEPEQLANPVRLRTLIARDGIKYPVLLCGETAAAKDKLPQALGWDSWPTTYFVGRDGLVRAVHSGFPSRGSGALHQKEKQAFITAIERLLSENRTSLQ
jgi:thiol-disulfide isomerase/thioredoxin